ncbi:hypothetical protein MLD38_030730 [Melastoma candidum]|uniref:Uncharacterized protein n=1 Tax=Melastoma candidum TaxID=119954 RepID=A0ACB9MM08_9MYRT|nr:hypothetical protein MLD38_030730 [Melastoma candidum]
MAAAIRNRVVVLSSPRRLLLNVLRKESLPRMDCDSRNGGGDAPSLPEYAAKERYCLFPRSSHWKAAKEDVLELTLCPPGENRGNHGRCRPSNSYLQFNPGNKTSAAEKGASRAATHHYSQDIERNAEYFAPPPPQPNTSAHNKPSQKRNAAAAAVGWPPVQSFRKNLASTGSTKQSVTQNVVSDKAVDWKKTTGLPPSPRGMFVKINMEGVPIGRKVDLLSCESYEKLAATVDELFRDLRAAQSDPSIVESAKPITGLLDGTGEYTLVYEDHEGDRVLIGDVPWKMFVATARRLHVLKRTNLSITNRESSNRQGA